MTTIIQRSGSIVLDVEKRNVKHFEVETPLLAALVKGTRFRVTVEKDRSYVDVLRGQVEVSDLRSGQYALVEPEQTAKVSAQHSVFVFKWFGHFRAPSSRARLADHRQTLHR